MAIKLWNWEKKPSTSPGRLKRGDIFCFEYDKTTYCFGRIIELKLKQYCIVEFFDYISDKPEINEEIILEAERMIPLMNVNCDSLFYSKMYGIDARIIGHQDDYTAADYDEIFILNSVIGGWAKEDLHGNITPIPDEERSKYISYNWKSSKYVKEDLTEAVLQKKYNSSVSSKDYPTDPEEMYRLVDTLSDGRKYDEVIEALSSFPEEKMNCSLLGILFASYNNSGRFDEALDSFEKFKSFYEGKMRLWYYYAAYAQIGKKEYNDALKSIEAGFEECEREREAGTVEMKDYNRDIGDFKDLRYRCQKALDEKEKFNRIGGFVIEKDVLVRYEDDKVTTDIVIPDGIREIEPDAFANCKTLKSVVIPEGVEKIWTDAFEGCVNLKNITFPNSLKQINQNPRCLEDTKWYKEYPKGQVIAGKYLYKYTDDEEEVVIEEGVEIIGQKAFLRNQTIRKVIIPSSVKEMHACIFMDCTNLEKVEMANGIESISSYAFGNCVNLEEINLPSSVVKLSNDVFAGCKNLKTVNLPDSLKELDGGAFLGCKSLEILHLPENVEGITDSRIGWNHQIGGALFKDCEKLREVSFPKGIKKILEETFAGCTSIQRIIVENPDMMFGKDTFGKKAKYPEALYETSPELPLHLSDGDIKQYIDLDKLSNEIKAKMFIKRQSKSLDSFWEKSINKGNAKAIGEKINELKATKLSAKEKKNADTFFEKYGGLI